ncbi:MAG: 1-aminocyclopropane-1-carboxylate deaminase/D-cysteine desulfhydrase [Flavobacteriales bacterium]
MNTQTQAEELFTFPKVQNQKVEFYWEGEDYKFTINRLDEVSDDASGNKFFKLKYNVFSALQRQKETILTFGGPWSNHIYATASTCKKLSLNSIGIIRGEEPIHYSDTLKHARTCGMELHFISREEYREKNEDYFKAWLRDEFGSFQLVPEGGSNFLGVQGCMEIPPHFPEEATEVYMAAGTGATAAGVLLGGKNRVNVVSALKGGEFLRDDIKSQIYWSTVSDEITDEVLERMNLITDAHYGGYAKTTPELILMIQHFYEQTGIKLEPIYTGKALSAMLRDMKTGRVSNDGSALLVHTGGLQGIPGIESRIKAKLF